MVTGRIAQFQILYTSPKLLTSSRNPAEKGYIITRDNVKTTLTLNGRPGPSATIRGRIYVMDFRVLEAQALFTSRKWHRRLGYISNKTLIESLKTKAIEGIKMEEIEKEDECEA